MEYLVRPATRSIVEGHAAIDGVMVDDQGGPHKGLIGWWRLVREVRAQGFQIALLLRPTWRHALLLWAARIPVRIGTASRVYSGLLTHRVPQHRSRQIRHESEYNLELLAPLGLEIHEPPLPKVVTSDGGRGEAEEFLAEEGLDPGRFVLLHPGSGGSARDWPPGHFADLARRLGAVGWPVVVSTGPDESGLLQRLRPMVGEVPVAWTEGRLSLTGATALIGAAAGVVTNSTGTMHLAAAQGVPTVAVFSPIRACTPVRWGPRGWGPLAVLRPPVPACDGCLGPRCPYFDCMGLVSVEEVETTLLRLMSPAHRAEERRPMSSGY